MRHTNQVTGQRPLTLVDLVTLLEEHGIDSRCYSLAGYGDERYCIDRDRVGFAVFYGERGHRNDEVLYGLEAEACQDLVERILADPTTRMRRSNS
jgi:hypothetical protein